MMQPAAHAERDREHLLCSSRSFFASRQIAVLIPSQHAQQIPQKHVSQQTPQQSIQSQTSSRNGGLDSISRRELKSFLQDLSAGSKTGATLRKDRSSQGSSQGSQQAWNQKIQGSQSTHQSANAQDPLQKALIMDPNTARNLVRSICNACGLDPSSYMNRVARGEGFAIQGIKFERVGNYYIAYPQTKSASDLLSSISKGIDEGGFRFTTNYLDLEEIIKDLERAGISLEHAMNNPLDAAAAAMYNAYRLYGSSGRSRISRILNFFSNIIADRIARDSRGEAEKIERILRRTRRGYFYGLEVGQIPSGRFDMMKTASNIEMLNIDPVWRVYVEDAPRIYLVIDKSGSMNSAAEVFKNIAYAAGIAALMANSCDAAYDVILFDHSVYHITENRDADEAIASLGEALREGSGGTSYASAIDYTVKNAEPGSIVAVIGDYIDNTLPPPDIVSEASAKDLRFILIPTPIHERYFLESLSKTLGADIIYPREIFK
jgi:hypothetical protein